MKKHWFRTTDEAYDHTRWSEKISGGDLLIVPSEGVIGIAHDWPVAVTASRGQLHACTSGYAFTIFHPSIIFAAIYEARARGYELDHTFARFAN